MVLPTTGFGASPCEPATQDPSSNQPVGSEEIGDATLPEM